MHLIENVLTNDKRKKLLEDVQPLLVDGITMSAYSGDLNQIFPGKQTHDTLHLHPDFISTINYMVELVNKEMGKNLMLIKAWANWTNGSKKDINWHCHPCDYALVYYMKTPLPFFSNGTLFRNGLFKAPQNSMIIFPAEVEHTAPTSPFRFDRYTIAMDLDIRNDNDG